MHFSNANKALIITILLSSSVVMLAFNFHINKRNALIAETYFEILPEDDIFEDFETLEEILKSFDEIKTNRAFNETNNNEDFEDEEFKSTMDKIRNRETQIQEPNLNSEAKPDIEEDNTDYIEVQDLINKQRKNRESNLNSENKNSSISFSLVDRDLLNNPTPIYLCELGGKIVITILVDENGNVTDASYNTASLSNNGCLIDHALEYAKAAKFNADASKLSQIGSITFQFKGKQ